MRKARKRTTIIVLSVFLFAVLMFTTASYLITMPRVIEELTVEAGSDMPTVRDFLKKNYKKAELISGLDDSVDMETAADYTVVIKVYWKEYTSVLHVVDTIAPKVSVKSREIYDDETLEPEDFIDRIEDVSDTTVSFAKTPDFTVPGKKNVIIAVTDISGNKTEAEAEVNILHDSEAPVISGVEEITIPAGTSVSYKRGVTVTDNRDPKPELIIDNSGVDLNTVGDYPVTYIATDKCGNVTKVSSILHVEKPTVENATEEMVNNLADEILKEITTPDMSQYEVAKAIFHWVYNRIKFKDGTPKTDWVQGAYRGLAERTGDCYVYAMTSKCLLTRAGIKNMDIEKIPSYSRHYWNLIDIGEGWHHFDCGNGRVEGVCLFYLTDAELMRFSKNHNDSHNYDRSKYPEIP